MPSGPGRHVRARPPPAHCRSYPKVVGSVLHWLHAVPLVPGVGLARAAQQLLVVETEEAELATVRAAESWGAVALPARALGLLAQQLLHQVVEGVVGAQVGEGRSVLAHRAGGRHLHLPAAGHAHAAEVVPTAQSHGVAEGVVADRTEQLLLEGAGRPGGRRGTRLHTRSRGIQTCNFGPTPPTRQEAPGPPGERRPAPSVLSAERQQRLPIARSALWRLRLSSDRRRKPRKSGGDPCALRSPPAPAGPRRSPLVLSAPCRSSAVWPGLGKRKRPSCAAGLPCHRKPISDLKYEMKLRRLFLSPSLGVSGPRGRRRASPPGPGSEAEAESPLSPALALLFT